MKYDRLLDGFHFSFPPLIFPSVWVARTRSCEVLSFMVSFGGNGGAVAAPFSMGVWWKYGMVAMSGERAQGLVPDARSCSSVGSMKLLVCARTAEVQ